MFSPCGATPLVLLEDGVTFGSLVAGQNGSVQVVCTLLGGISGRLDAWMDWNRDGDWVDPLEQIFADQPMVNGLNTLTFPVPGSRSTRVAST